MEYKIQRFVAGPLENNTYIISNKNKECLIVDPTLGLQELLSYIDKDTLKPEAILLTHGHFDHVMGISEIKEQFPDLDIYCHPGESELLRNPDLNGSYLIGKKFALVEPVKDLVEGEMSIGSFTFTVIVIPGHSPGGCAFLFGPDCLSGDILFANSIGRSDFPGGDGELLVEGIKSKLLKLDDTTTIWPGHGGRTTIGREKRLNPFIQ